MQAVRDAQCNRYPTPVEFVEAAAEYTGYPPDNLIIGPGLDGVIDSLTRLFLDPEDRVFIPAPTYTYYELMVRLCGAQPVISSKDVRSLSEVPAGTKLIFLCSPNNPTGAVIEEEVLRAFLDITDVVVFLDEAYIEFSGGSMVRLVREYENLVVGRTLSKAFGLAGLRLGYAVAPEWIAEQYRRIAPTFGISSTSLAAGVAALKDTVYMRSSVSKIVAERERLLGEIVEASPSRANFLYIETAERSSLVYERLIRKGVVVRDCSGIPGCGDHHIRVTVGTPEQNDAFLDAYLAGC